MSSHSFSIACECGATIGLSPGVTNVSKDQELYIVIDAWENLHSGEGHERVACEVARQIRLKENRRVIQNAWRMRNPEHSKAIQKRYRDRKRLSR